VAKLARQVARGIEEVAGMQARLRSVPPVAPVTQQAAPPVPDEGAPYVERHDLAECAGLALGSEWASGTLVGKPAGVFTSTSTMHGGQESTLLSMMLPLLHHGCVITGIPYTEPALNTTRTGGTPYGASHYAGLKDDPQPSDEEAVLARVLGRRIAQLAAKLA